MQRAANQGEKLIQGLDEGVIEGGKEVTLLWCVFVFLLSHKYLLIIWRQSYNFISKFGWKIGQISI